MPIEGKHKNVVFNWLSSRVTSNDILLHVCTLREFHSVLVIDYKSSFFLSPTLRFHFVNQTIYDNNYV